MAVNYVVKSFMEQAPGAEAACFNCSLCESAVKYLPLFIFGFNYMEVAVKPNPEVLYFKNPHYSVTCTL